MLIPFTRQTTAKPSEPTVPSTYVMMAAATMAKEGRLPQLNSTKADAQSNPKAG